MCDLTVIPGVGVHIAADLKAIGIHSVADLKGKDPEKLYMLDCERKGRITAIQIKKKAA